MHQAAYVACAIVLTATIQPADARTRAHQSGVPSGYESLVAKHAAANGVPTSLVHRVIMRESKYSPRVVSKGNYGIMQIKLGTARSMGYTGSAAGLLDPDTNMTYAVKYLAGAYRVAGGSESGAVANYARGYRATGVTSRSAARSYRVTSDVAAEPAYTRTRVAGRTQIVDPQISQHRPL